MLIITCQVDIADVGHIKERLVRIVIEIAKREFPQNWSDFFSDLGVLQNKGVCIISVSNVFLFPWSLHLETYSLCMFKKPFCYKCCKDRGLCVRLLNVKLK